MPPPNTAAITEALIDTLVSGLEPGILVGDGEAPEQDPAQSFTRYLVVFTLPSVDVQGNLSEPTTYPTVSYQLTCVGASQMEAQYVAHQARTRLESNPPTVSGLDLSVRFSFADTATRDDDFAPPLWYVTEEVQVLTGA